jgi:multidrug efflux pump subunit AcrB
MKGLIRFSLDNHHAIIVLGLAIIVLGVLMLLAVPVDILPVFKSPAVQVLTFYTGMPAEGIEKDITNRMERWTGQANGMKLQESRSILGASIVRNYFYDDVDRNGALTEVNSLALATLPNLPPGTLPPVVLPFDPTSTTPVAIVALSSDHPSDTEATLYDVARYQIRNYIMQVKGATAPVVIGGKLRAVMLYVDPIKLQARNMSPAEVMDAVERSNLFFPSGDVKIGDKDFALSSNSMFKWVEMMGDIPLKAKTGNAMYLRDVAEPRDASFIQTNVVRVNGRRQVYIPVYRQVGASTLSVVNELRRALPSMEARISGAQDVHLHLVMDQSVYVKESIGALVQEASLGSVLCALVILLFLGAWRMTLIAIMTLPLSVLVAIICLYYSGCTVNVMTLAGLTLAIGPMIDSAIICLENTHRYLGMGVKPKEAAMTGASEVAMPELVSTICTFLVLMPLALMPGMGKFLFLPMALAVMFSMTCAYLLSRTLVPCFSALLLSSHDAGHQEGSAGWFARWEQVIQRGIEFYVLSLGSILKHRRATVTIAFALLGVTLLAFGPIMRRDFFPESDAGAFEIAVRAAPGTRIDEPPNISLEEGKGMEAKIARVEKFIKAHIPAHNLELVISEIGLTADWSAAYTANSGPQDALVKVQLTHHRSKTAQDYVSILRRAFAADPRFYDLEFAFDSGGLVRGALNEGKSTPINIQLKGKDQEVLHKIAMDIRDKVSRVDGVVDARVLQSLDAPELTVEVDRAKAAQLGLSQDYIMKNVIAATNSSITFNKKNFWIDPKTNNQYFVGVAYPEARIQSIEDLENIPIIAPNQKKPIPLRMVATIRPTKVPTEVHHVDLQPAIDLTMGIEGRDLGHVCDEVSVLLDQYGQKIKQGLWQPYDPSSTGTNRKLLGGSQITLTGEYSRMQTTFVNLGGGLVLAALLIYFLMVGLDKSFIVPLAVMLVVPLCLCGVLPVLYFTGSAINVQSLLGIIFIVGIKVANTVLMTDYAQELRRHEGLSPTEAIRKAAGLRVRPVTMTALAALFAMIPTALSREANAPLARAILGGLFAGEPATLFVLPALYSLMVRDEPQPAAAEDGHSPIAHNHGDHHIAPGAPPEAGI